MNTPIHATAAMIDALYDDAFHPENFTGYDPYNHTGLRVSRDGWFLSRLIARNDRIVAGSARNGRY